MPTCPGCERSVSYDRLEPHLEYCADLSDGDRKTMTALMDLDERISETEMRLDRRISRLEAELAVANKVADEESGDGDTTRFRRS